MSRRHAVTFAIATLVTCAGAVAACGGEVPQADPSLSPAAIEGHQIALNSGCAACHGGDFRGGVAPSFQGLAGATITLNDGSKVLADTAYLTRAIEQPQAQVTKGYLIQMPANSLTPDQVAKVVAYIEALGPPRTSG